jgi:hypothetical protein
MTGKKPVADGAIFGASATACVGNAIRKRPTNRESHPIMVVEMFRELDAITQARRARLQRKRSDL